MVYILEKGKKMAQNEFKFQMFSDNRLEMAIPCIYCYINGLYTNSTDMVNSVTGNGTIVTIYTIRPFVASYS